MKITKNQMYIGIGIAILAIWYFRNRKPSGDSENRISIGKNENLTWASIAQSDRKKATAGLNLGDVGMINGDSECTISDFWKDDSGKIGAFQCEGRDVYDLPQGSYFEF